MFCRIFYLFCSLLAITTAFTPAQVQSFFYILPGGTVNQPFIRTKNNTISYSVEEIFSNGTLLPQFLSINLSSGDAKPILTDIMNDCGQNNATYSRIYYHASQSTLVYYCTRNNTLLILDENDYTVKDTIPTQVVGEFNETKISAEGDSVVILGTGTPFTTNYTAAQLVKINLSTKQVTRLVVFSSGVAEGEILTSYASTGVLSFVLTNQANVSDLTTTVTIYSLIFVGNTYKLTQLSNFSYAFILPQRTNELYCLGTYLVTNSYQDLLFINVQGGVSERFLDVNFLAQPSENPSQGIPNYFEVPNYAMQHGSSDLYAYFFNKSALHITSTGLVVTSNLILESTEVHFAIGNQDARDLLFNVSSPTMTVFDAKTVSPIYDSPNQYNALFLSNASYTAIDLFSYVVVDRKTNNFTASLSSAENFFTQYFEETNQVLYYIDLNASDSTTIPCKVKYIQPDTLAEGEVLTFDPEAEASCSSSSFIYLRAGGDIMTPDFALNNQNGNYFLYTKEHGLINYTAQDQTQIIVPNFDDMSVYEISSSTGNDIEVTKYAYNGTSFNLQTSYTIGNIPFNDITTFLVADSKMLAIYFGEQFGMIDLTDGAYQGLDVPADLSYFSSFQDNSGQNYFILAYQSVEGLVSPLPYVYGTGQVPIPVPGSDEYTMSAGAAGRCTYWVEQGYVASFGVARFYDACSESRYQVDFSIIS